MPDKRTCVLVNSSEVDFTKMEWIVRPDDYETFRVGAGFYLAVPVENEEDAKRLETFIGELRAGSATISHENAL